MTRTLESMGIDRLSVAERLDLIGQIWDSLENPDGTVSIPEWHKSELENRRAAAEANPEAAIPWESVKALLANRS